jgi:rod shape-determining protein MreC
VPTYSPGRRRVIAALALTSLLLVTLDLSGNRVFDGIRSGASVITRPVRTAADVATQPVVRLWRSFRDYDRILEENRALRAQVDAQRSAEIAAQNAIIENQDLLALEGLESLASYDSVTARLIGQSPSNFDQQVEIDRGAIHGIRVGMSALNEAGLVGKVTRVLPQSSVIMLATDPSFAVPVKVLGTVATAPTATAPTSSDPDSPSTGPDPTATSGEGTTTVTTTVTTPVTTTETTTVTTTSLPTIVRETGVLRGQGIDDLPRVSFVSGGTGFGRIEVGDTVFTAGGSTSLAPPNIPVGRVINIITRTGTAGQELEVELTADLARLQFVRVVLYQPPTEAG